MAQRHVEEEPAVNPVGLVHARAHLERLALGDPRHGLSLRVIAKGQRTFRTAGSAGTAGLAEERH